MLKSRLGWGGGLGYHIKAKNMSFEVTDLQPFQLSVKERALSLSLLSLSLSFPLHNKQGTVAVIIHRMVGKLLEITYAKYSADW